MDNLDLLLKRFDEALECRNKEDLLKINMQVNNKLKELVLDFSNFLTDKKQ